MAPHDVAESNRILHQLQMDALYARQTKLKVVLYSVFLDFDLTPLIPISSEAFKSGYFLSRISKQTQAEKKETPEERLKRIMNKQRPKQKEEVRKEKNPME